MIAPLGIECSSIEYWRLGVLESWCHMIGSWRLLLPTSRCNNHCTAVDRSGGWCMMYIRYDTAEARTSVIRGLVGQYHAAFVRRLNRNVVIHRGAKSALNIGGACPSVCSVCVSLPNSPNKTAVSNPERSKRPEQGLSIILRMLKETYILKPYRYFIRST